MIYDQNMGTLLVWWELGAGRQYNDFQSILWFGVWRPLLFRERVCGIGLEVEPWKDCLADSSFWLWLSTLPLHSVCCTICWINLHLQGWVRSATFFLGTLLMTTIQQHNISSNLFLAVRFNEDPIQPNQNSLYNWICFVTHQNKIMFYLCKASMRY